MASTSVKRHYLRHEADIPVEIIGNISHPTQHEQGRNISFGGLSFTSDTPIPVNYIVRLAIHITEPSFEAQARVAWCRPLDDGFEVGVEFMSREVAYMARMVEQVCHIEQYRKAMLQHGRKLTSQEAAIEWIEKYATSFPAMEKIVPGS